MKEQVYCCVHVAKAYEGNALHGKFETAEIAPGKTRRPVKQNRARLQCPDHKTRMTEPNAE